MLRAEQINKSVDSEWFLKFRNINRPLLLTSYKIRQSELKNVYSKFRTTLANPDLYYDVSDITFDSVKQQLRELQGEIIHCCEDKAIAEAYTKKIEEALADINIIEASRNHDWDAFSAYNIERFGEIEASLLKDISNGVRATESELKVASQYFEGLNLPKVIDERIYSAEEIVGLWNEKLSEAYPKWKCVLTDEFNFVKTQNKGKKILIPSSMSSRGKRVRSLYAHEVGVHVRRREAGKQSTLQLLSVGLADSNVTEEGLAAMAEQISRHSTNYRARDRYIALAFATGYINGNKHDFRDTYQFLEKMFKKRSETSDNISSEAASNMAWRLCIKIFRGGNPSIPGCCLYKEKIYYEGTRKVWDVFRQNPEDFALWDRGKFDLTNQSHIDLVKKYT